MGYKFIVKKPYKLNSRKEAVIYLRYWDSENSVLFSTKERITDPAKNWDVKKGQPKKTYPDKELPDSLDAFKAKIKAIERDLTREDKLPSPSLVKSLHEQSEAEKQPEKVITDSLVVQWKAFVKDKTDRKKITDGTARTLYNVIASFERFLKSVNKAGISPDKLSLKEIRDFETYMIRKEQYKPNTRARFLKKLKEFLKDYTENLNGELKFNIKQIEYRETHGVKINLTFDELEGLEALELSGRKAQIRDLFVLQCYTGLRISDLKRVDQNIIGDKISLTSQKTRTETSIPITPKIREILERYDYYLPKFADPVINREIKGIFKLASPGSIVQVENGGEFTTVPKWQELTTHDAIRTFVILSAERGMSITSIAKMTGKSIPVLLKHYLSESQKFAETEFEKAWGIVSPLKVAK